MAGLVPVAYAQALIETDLDAATLQMILDDEESEVVRRFGAHGDGVTAVVETVSRCCGGELFVSRPVVSVTSVTSNGSAVASSSYTLYGNQGRLGLIGGGRWVSPVVVTYVPVDDRARRREIIVELVRLRLERTAMKSESVAGEYSASAPDWEAARAALYRRLMFTSV